MRIYLTKASDINSGFTSQDVLSAHITQKVENGYIVNMGGTEVFAHCSLDLNIGDFLKLKVAENSASRIVFKVIQCNVQELETQSKLPISINLPDTPELQTAFNLLLKLNLPIKKERLTFIMNLLDRLTREERQEPSLLSTKELPSQTQRLLFHKALLEYIKSDSAIFENQLLKLLQDLTSLKDETFNLDKGLLLNQSKATDIKEHLALKALNLLHKQDYGNNTCFFALPIPVYHKIYMKISGDSSADDKQQILHISFIINTKNLGSVLVSMVSINGKIAASSTFENKETMDMVKKALAINKNAPGLIKAMELKVGKVSHKDFFFDEIEERPITTGINLKI